jgi:hypothetical protein
VWCRYSYSSNSKRSGLTLAEVLLIMTLILITTGLMAGVVREYSTILRFGAGKTRTLEAVQTGLIRAAGELAQAARVSTPAPTSSAPSTRLVFDRLSPDPAIRALRLPDPSTTLPPANWDPVAPGNLITVEYELSSEIWQRTVGSESQDIATGISGFSATNSAGASMLISVSVNEDRQVRTLSTVVYMPARFDP